MPIDHTIVPLDATDRKLAALTLAWFEQDLRERIDASMDRRLAGFMGTDSSREHGLVTAA